MVRVITHISYVPDRGSGDPRLNYLSLGVGDDTFFLSQAGGNSLVSNGEKGCWGGLALMVVVGPRGKIGKQVHNLRTV